MRWSVDSSLPIAAEALDEYYSQVFTFSGYFIPLHNLSLTPEAFDQKVNNVAFAFGLMKDAGLPKPKARPEGNFSDFPTWS